MSKYNLINIFEGMSNDEMSKAQEADRLENHPERDTIKKIQALMAKEKKDVKEGEAVDLAIEASQEKAGIEVDESFKSLAKKLDKQKGIDKDEAAKIAGSIAAKKAAGAGKGPTAKQKKRMNEVRIEREVANRIEGLMNIQLKAKFLDVFEDLWLDLIEEDPFYAEDVINHLNNEMHKRIDDRQAQGDKLANIPEIPMFKGTRDALDDISIREDSTTEEIDYKLDPYEDRDEIIKQVMSLLIKEKGASREELKGFIEMHIEDILNAEDDDAIVDEFSQYLSVNESDKALQEHFKRFK